MIIINMEIDDLKKICDYQETTQNGPVTISFIDFAFHQDEMAEKRAVRETAIDALMDDEKIPEYHRVREKVDAGDFFENTDVDPMDIVTLPNSPSIKVKSKIIHPSNFISDKHIEDLIINEWIKISKNSIVTKELSKTNSDKFDSAKQLPPSGIADVHFTTRRLLTKIKLVSNLIAMKCRIGNATSILYNPDILNKIDIDTYYLFKSAQLDIIPCNLVPSNSIIILRNDSLKSNNINFLVQVNKSDGLYYFNSFQSMNRKCAIIEII